MRQHRTRHHQPDIMPGLERDADAQAIQHAMDRKAAGAQKPAAWIVGRPVMVRHQPVEQAIDQKSGSKSRENSRHAEGLLPQQQGFGQQIEKRHPQHRAGAETQHHGDAAIKG